MIKMKIPFRMKSKDCTGDVRNIATGCKNLESGINRKDVKKLCRAAKDSAKDFDKAFSKARKEYEKMKNNVKNMLLALEGIKNLGRGPDSDINTVKQAVASVGSVFEKERKQEQELAEAFDSHFFKFSK